MKCRIFDICFTCILVHIELLDQPQNQLPKAWDLLFSLRDVVKCTFKLISLGA